MERNLAELREEFPTPVGMNRGVFYSGAKYRRVPHARGDEPLTQDQVAAITRSSPRPWG